MKNKTDYYKPLKHQLQALNRYLDEDYKKLSDKYKKLKLSHKNQEKLLTDFRTLLIAMQNGIVGVDKKTVEEKLRKVNLALGYNQWTSVKEERLRG